MYYVYILTSKKTKMLYIGFTEDLKRRFSEHNSGKESFTSKFKPWKIVYYESYLNKQDATIRESKLKQYGASLGQLKKRLKYSLISTF